MTETEQTQLIKDLILSNEKLTATLALYNHYHLTKQEKQEAAQIINQSPNSQSVKKAAESLNKKFNSAYQFSDQDSKWSPGFIAELLKYHEHQVGYNPIIRLKNPFSIVKAYFTLKANEENLDEIDKARLEEISNALPEAMKTIKDVYKDLEEKNIVDSEEEEEEEEF